MWREMLFFNERIEQGIRRSLASGLVRINPNTGLIDISPAGYAMAYDGNWLFFGHNTALRDCFTWHSIMFNCFDNFVPEFCRLRCYKVVIKTRNFLDAIRFRNAVLAAPHTVGGLTPLQGKVGIDERDYSGGHFNGFIYCDGPEGAQEKYKVVRQILDDHVPDGKNIPAIIKRTCTEFERKHGSTDEEFWQAISPEDRTLERILSDIYEGNKSSAVQPDWLQNKVIAKMAKWANATGDKSWMEYFGCEDILTMKAVTYHNTKEVKKSTQKRKKTSKKRTMKSKKGEK